MDLPLSKIVQLLIMLLLLIVLIALFIPKMKEVIIPVFNIAAVLLTENASTSNYN